MMHTRCRSDRAGGCVDIVVPIYLVGAVLGRANMAHFLVLPLLAVGNPHFRHAKMPIWLRAMGTAEFHGRGPTGIHERVSQQF
jgi:hypothetical protein